MSGSDPQDGGGMRPGPAEASDQESPGPSSLQTPDGPTVSAPRGGAHLVFAGILLSRIAGFVRLSLMARFMATGIAADAFGAALKIPNLLQNLLGEGTLSASFIPAYSRLLKEGRREDAGRVAGAVFSLLFVIAGALGLLGVIAAPLLIDLINPKLDAPTRALAIDCIRILFPMTSILVLSAWALGVQNSHRRFFMSYVAPVLWNGAMIAAVLFWGPDVTPVRLAIIMSWAALLGGALQFLVQLPLVLRLERELKIRWAPRMPEVRDIMVSAVPAISGRGVVQLSSFVDLYLASYLTTGAIATIGYASAIYMLPISLFGMSVAAAQLPEMARDASATMDALRTRVNAGLLQIYYFVVPSFVVFLVLGDVVVAGLFQGGRFGAGETLQVYATLAAFSLGLIATTGTRLFSSTFFALRDTKTPAWTAFMRVVLAAMVGAAFMFPFDRIEVAQGFAGTLTLGAAGLALGSAASAWIEWFILQRSLNRRLGKIGAGGGAILRMLGMALLAAAAGRGIAYVTGDIHPALRAVLVLGPTGLIYLGGTYLLGLAPAQALFSRFRR